MGPTAYSESRLGYKSTIHPALRVKHVGQETPLKSWTGRKRGNGHRAAQSVITSCSRSVYGLGAKKKKSTQTARPFRRSR